MVSLWSDWGATTGKIAQNLTDLKFKLLVAASLTCNQQQVTAAVTSQVCPASQELIKIFIFPIKSIFWMINNPAPGHNKKCNWSANLEIQKMIWSFLILLTGLALALASQLELISKLRNCEPCQRLEAGNLNLHQNVTIWLLQVRLASTKGLKDEKSAQSSVSCAGLADDIVTNWTNLGVSGLSQGGIIRVILLEKNVIMFTNI